MAATWNIKGDQINIYGEKIFRAKFPMRVKAERVLRSGPWMLKNDLAALEQYRPRTLPENYKLDSCDFWNQINIPWDMLKKEIITCIAKDLGPVTPINYRDAEKWTNSARVKISIDITKPLKN